VMTALPIDVARVTELGAPAVLLRKPFELKQLIAAARHLLRLNHAA
jgi:DNA-binding response OmpR family regulator